MGNSMHDFVKARDAALLSLDEARIRGYARKYNIRLPDDPETFWIGIHKARTANLNLPMEARTLSKRWLLACGSEPMDDGDVPV